MAKDPGYVKWLEDKVKSGPLPDPNTVTVQSSVFNQILARLSALEVSKGPPQQIQQGGTSRASNDRAGRGDSPRPTTQQGLPTTSMVSAAVGPPPSALATDVSDALSRISVALDPTGSEVAGIHLHPEYFIQHVGNNVPVRALHHNTLTVPELMYGMARVSSSMTNPQERATYDAHFRFLGESIIQGLYPAKAYVNYNREVTNKVIKGELTGFPICDLPSVALHLHKDEEYSKEQQRPSHKPYYRGGKRPYSSSAQKADATIQSNVATRDLPHNPAPSQMPEWWPEEVC